MPSARVLSFTDPLACQAAVQSVTQAEILPTARGDFFAEMTQVSMNKLRMQRFHSAQPLLSSVTIASDRKLIGFLIEPISSNPYHCGIEVTPNDIFVYGHDVLHQRSTSAYHVGTMSLPAEDFPAMCQSINGHYSLEEPVNTVVRPEPVLMSKLRTLHKAVGELARDVPEVLERQEVRQAMEEQLIHVMIRCLGPGPGAEVTIGNRRHHAIVTRFEEFLEANPDRPLYLTEICAGIGVAERTLRACCEEHMGMGPIRFLTLRRMHLVRRALLTTDPSKATITRIVTDHGVWELGRFSVAYRALFGESPSETSSGEAEEPWVSFPK